MKKKLELGSQVDINASFDGGADDTSVTYSVPADQQDVISVTSAGVVEALAVGTATVEVKDAVSGNLIRAVVFQVLSAADFAVQGDLDTGVTELQIEIVELSTFTKITGGTAFASGTYEGSPSNAFDGLDGTLGYPPATLWGSAESFGGTVNAFIGKTFESPKMVKKIRVQWVTAPIEVGVFIANGSLPGTLITSIPVSYQDFNGPQTVTWQEVILPAYTPATGIYLAPSNSVAVPGTYWANNGGTIDRFRVWEIELYE